MDCRRVQLGFETNVQLFLLLVWNRILPARFRKNFVARRGPCFSAFRRDTSQRVAYGNRCQPSVYLYEGDKLCSKKCLRGSGILPSPMRFIRLVSDFRKLSHALPFDLLSRSLKIRGTFLSGHAADPIGKDIIALYRSKSVTKNN